MRSAVLVWHLELSRKWRTVSTRPHCMMPSQAGGTRLKSGGRPLSALQIICIRQIHLPACCGDTIRIPLQPAACILHQIQSHFVTGKVMARFNVRSNVRTICHRAPTPCAVAIAAHGWATSTAWKIVQVTTVTAVQQRCGQRMDLDSPRWLTSIDVRTE